MIFHPDDLQGGHQLLLFLGEGAQLFLHPRKERGLDGQPGGGEERSETARDDVTPLEDAGPSSSSRLGRRQG